MAFGIRGICVLLLSVAVGGPQLAGALAPDEARLRLIVETDAGGDPDDEQSFVRFLLYANEWDVEGIIANRPVARPGENSNPERTGLGILNRLIDAYGLCHTNLVRHDPRYPSPSELKRRTVPGYADTDAGVNLVLAALDRPDPRPVWFLNWGTDRGSAPSCLLRALDKALKERGPGGYAALKQKLRLSSAEAFGEHTAKLTPSFPLWVDTFRPELDGKRWYHRFSALTARAGGFDIERDVRTGHGPLGALYPINTTHWLKEGDTMSFLYLVPNGLSDVEEPGQGSWAGRYGKQPEFPGKPYYWANQADAGAGAPSRDRSLERWAEHIQNDFRARMDWCVQSPQGANHPPLVRLRDRERAVPLRVRAAPGESIVLDASGTTDPDGNQLRFDWFVYPEAGTWAGTPTLDRPTPASATLRVPQDAAGKSIHVVLTVTDDGQPPLTRYARAILEVEQSPGDRAKFEACFQPPPDFTAASQQLRSPLLFADGTPVRDGADWRRRRGQIHEQWQEILGPWPPLIRSPALRRLGTTRRHNFLQERVRLEIGPGQESEGWLLTPEGAGPFPAVLVVYYEPDTSVGLGAEPWRDFGYQLARRGFVTLSIGTPGGNAWRPETGAAACQPLSYHAYVAANCRNALAGLPSVNPERIGIVGHSYGGKWALFAGAFCEGFAAVAASDPGIVFDETRPNVNYWEPWYLGSDPGDRQRTPGVPTPENPRTGAYKRLVESGHDLHELHALIAPRPFFVSGGSEDPPSRWGALNHSVAVNRLLGQTNRVALHNRPDHAPNPESNALIYEFFEAALR